MDDSFGCLVCFDQVVDEAFSCPHFPIVVMILIEAFNEGCEFLEWVQAHDWLLTLLGWLLTSTPM